MQKIFQEYGGVITTAMAIVALISVLGLLFAPGGTGWMDNAFKDVIHGFTDKVNDAVPGSSGAIPGGFGGAEDAALEGDGQTFYTLAPSTLTFGTKAPRSEFQSIKINGEALDASHYTVEDAAPGTTVTLSLDYLKTLDATTYSIEIVSANMAPAGTFVVIEPEKNEHGFYYNQPYTGYVSALGSDYALFFRKNGTMDLIRLVNNYTETCSYTISGNVVSASTTMGTIEGNVADDGTTMYCPQLGANVALGDESIAADEDYIYVYKDSLGGYEVVCIDKTQASYGAIRTGINGKPTVAMADRMFFHNENLVVAPVIPDSVTSIGAGAFTGCTNLTSITVPDSVTSIGDSTFYGCTSLTIIDIPDNVTSIGANAFIGCTNLTSITIPDSAASIGDAAFQDCANLVSVTFGENSRLTSIGERAFSLCPNLTSITLPDSVTTIGANAFWGCTSLAEITIPDGVTSVEQGAFYDCTSLGNITFEGSMAKWNAINKGYEWSYNVPATQVVCSDGAMSLS